MSPSLNTHPSTNSDVVIRVEQLTKEYRLGTINHGTLKQDLESWWARMRGKEDPNSIVAVKSSLIQSPSSKNRAIVTDSNPHFLALDNVSFDIKQGEAIGVIGRNGAGKSTLLKILSRVTAPTSGAVKIRGRIASLLEVGTGFHPELTGRENIFLNGTILGMKRAEIQHKLDEIVAFAEIDQFIDTPVKRYSSGMYVRLAFAVAAHLEPEILIIDEVLAVGDLQFQKKCLGKMQDVGKEGRTVLFVSHNMEAVRKLCTGGVLLHKGRVIASGKAEQVINSYVAGGFQSLSEFLILPPEGDVPGFAYKVVIEDNSGKPSNEIPIGEPWQVRIHIKINQRIEHFIIGLGFLTDLNMPLSTSWSKPVTIEPGEYQAVFREETVLLTTGVYPLVVGLSTHGRTFQYAENSGYLRVAEVSKGLDLVQVQGCGLILNQLQVEILKS
jgi:lipopolysaccharide transport system ATP-binding protein